MGKRNHQKFDLVPWDPEWLAPDVAAYGIVAAPRLSILECMNEFKRAGNKVMAMRLEQMEVAVSVSTDAIFHMMREDMHDDDR